MMTDKALPFRFHQSEIPYLRIHFDYARMRKIF